MSELTFEEFCQQTMVYTMGITCDWGDQRMCRNEQLGIQREVITKRKRHGDIYSGWKDGQIAYFLDGDEREFKTGADLYVAWMEKVCSIELKPATQPQGKPS